MKAYAYNTGGNANATGRNEAAERLAGYAVRAARTAGRIALFLAAPVIGLGYVVAFPFVGLGLLAWYGARAAARR
jgi:hypothetical protein